MTLTDLKGFLTERNRVSVGEIAGHFNTDKGTVESMLYHWVRKGKVEKKAGDAFSGTCCGKCGGHHVTWYRWIDD